MTAISQYYNTVKNCEKPMPILPSGEDAKAVFLSGKEVYGNPDYMKEAGYDEFAQLYEQKLQEGHEYCGGKPITTPKSEPTNKKKEAQDRLERLNRTVKFLTGNDKERAMNAINTIQRALKFL